MLIEWGIQRMNYTRWNANISNELLCPNCRSPPKKQANIAGWWIDQENKWIWVCDCGAYGDVFDVVCRYKEHQGLEFIEGVWVGKELKIRGVESNIIEGITITFRRYHD